MISLSEHLNSSINEGMSRGQLSSLVNSIKLTTSEPTSHQEEWLQVLFRDKNFFNESEKMYVKVSDLQGACNENDVLSIFYALAIKNNAKTNVADISAWDDRDGWQQFAIACMQARNRMWHPEWIKNKSYNFV